MSRAEILTESVKAVYAKRRKRLLEYDGGLSAFAGQGYSPPPVPLAVREKNALDFIKNNSSLGQKELLVGAGLMTDLSGEGKIFRSATFARPPGAVRRENANIPLSVQADPVEAALYMDEY